MKPLSTKNRALSIQQRLNNNAKELGLDANILRVRFSLERFLYRLSLTVHNKRIILKGAMLFILWNDKTFRPTRDADFLIKGKSDHETIRQVIVDICNIISDSDDAMLYDANTIKVETIKEGQQYEGTRVTLKSFLGTIYIPVQLDIGTGDIITPKAVEADFRVIIDELPAPRLNVYNRETVIAEKLQAMVNLDLTNSRMKDFYDIWLICTQFEFNKAILATAITATFKRRGTELPKNGIVCLRSYFYDEPSKEVQWKAFIRKSRIEPNDLSLEQVCKEISHHLYEVFEAL